MRKNIKKIINKINLFINNFIISKKINKIKEV